MFTFVLSFFVLSLIVCNSFANKNPFGDDKPKYASIDSHKGIVALDSFTFSKIVPSPTQTVVVFVYQKSQVGDYGTDSIRHDYFSFADKANVDPAFSDDVLFAQVIVNGAFNIGLATSFGLNADFVAPALFVFPRGSSYPIRYPVDQPYNVKSLSKFVASHLKGAESVAGLVKVLEPYVAQFYGSSKSAERVNILAAVESASNDLSATEKDYASYYVKVMNKILNEVGSSDSSSTGIFLESELKRLETTLKEAKMSEKSRLGVVAHVNVLKLFRNKQQEAASQASTGVVVDL